MKRASYKTERGHIALFALVLIPFLTTMTMLAVDIAAWNTLRDGLQEEAERIALQAAQLLPNAQGAEAFIRESVHTLRFPVDVELDERSRVVSQRGSSVRVGLRARYSSNFDVFLNMLPQDGGQEHHFEVRREAVARHVPADIVIVVPDGETMKPRLGEAPWGESSTWPHSFYFECSNFFPPEAIEGDEWENPDAPPEERIPDNDYDWPEEDLFRWATQTCYNPVFSEVKFAAISLYDSLAAMELNRVAVLFTPGDASGLGSSYAKGLRFREFFDPPWQEIPKSEGNWNGYYDTLSRLGDEACFLFSHFDDRYRLPVVDDYLLAGIHVPGPECPVIQTPQCDTPPGESGSYSTLNQLSSCYAKGFLKAREAIYWRAAKPIPAEPEAALIRAVSNIMTGGDDPEQLDRLGNLSTKNLRRIVLLSDTLPDPQDASIQQKVLGNLESQGIELVIAAFLHDSLSATERQTLLSRVNAYTQIARELNSTQQSLRVFLATSPQQLNTVLTPQLIALGRETSVYRRKEL